MDCPVFSFQSRLSSSILPPAQGGVTLRAYPGNTGDPATVPNQLEKLREEFELENIVLVGDRGMLTEARIEYIRRYPGIG